MAAGPRQIAERVVEALEAADASVAGWPGRVAAAVLLALGSSAAEQEQLASGIAEVFREDVLHAVEAAVHEALLSLGKSPELSLPERPGSST